MFEALWRPRGSKKVTLLGIFGSPAPGVVFRDSLNDMEIPQEEIFFVPYRPFEREWDARARLISLAEMDRENAEAEGREPDAGLLLALAILLGRDPVGRAAEFERSISKTWCAREEKLFAQDPDRCDIIDYSEDELLKAEHVVPRALSQDRPWSQFDDSSFASFGPIRIEVAKEDGSFLAKASLCDPHSSDEPRDFVRVGTYESREDAEVLSPGVLREMLLDALR